MTMLLVPALLMVSTIRFQSFKTLDLGIKRGYRGLVLVAGFIAMLVAYPHETLIVMAYLYFASGFIGLLMGGRALTPPNTTRTIDSRRRSRRLLNRVPKVPKVPRVPKGKCRCQRCQAGAYVQCLLPQGGHGRINGIQRGTRRVYSSYESPN